MACSEFFLQGVFVTLLSTLADQRLSDCLPSTVFPCLNSTSVWNIFTFQFFQIRNCQAIFDFFILLHCLTPGSSKIIISHFGISVRYFASSVFSLLLLKIRPLVLNLLGDVPTFINLSQFTSLFYELCFLGPPFQQSHQLLSLPLRTYVRRIVSDFPTYFLLFQCLQMLMVQIFHVVVQSLSRVLPYGLQPTRLLCPWYFPGKNTGIGCHFLLRGMCPSQRSDLCLLHWQADSLLLSHQRSPDFPQESSKRNVLKWGDGLKRSLLVILKIALNVTQFPKDAVQFIYRNQQQFTYFFQNQLLCALCISLPLASAIKK